MTIKERDRVLKEGFFYHVTLRDRVASIMAKGLDPQYSNLSIYGRYFEDPVLFLCTGAALAAAKNMFENGIEVTPHVVLRIPAAVVAQHECDVDHSFPDRTEGLTFLECLEQVGFIACYGMITPDLLDVLEHQDEQGRWEGGE